MKVKLLRGCVANGKPHKKGATIEVSEKDGGYLLGLAAAEKIEEKQKEKE